MKLTAKFENSPAKPKAPARSTGDQDATPAAQEPCAGLLPGRPDRARAAGGLLGGGEGARGQPAATHAPDEPAASRTDDPGSDPRGDDRAG
jgi:hypothetical protein